MLPRLASFPRYTAVAVAAITLFSPTRGFAQGGLLDFSAAGWIQYGRIVKSLDTTVGHRLNEGMQSAGAQFLAEYKDGSVKIKTGLGVQMSHYLPPDYGSGGYAPMVSTPYVAEADLEFAFINRDDLKLSAQAGFFPYDYAPESQNLGLYLLRGPVYPGMLTSGFETKYVLPIANNLGFKLSHQVGGFQQDLLFTFENEWPTYWDLSPAYIAAYGFGATLHLGGGVQLNHFIPVDGKITDPQNDNVRYIYAKTSGGSDTDTVFVAFRGVKLMANFSFDPKALLGGLDGDGPLGPEDLKLYGEIAVLGLDRDRAHNDLYGPISKRMPMMIGFNLPACKYLDRLNVELEYYGAPWVDDPSIFEHTRTSRLTPIPKRSALDTNTTRDNFKWSIYASKIFAGHAKISAQAASDHFRPGIFTGYGEAAPPKNEVPFFSPKEWYWMTKIAFFF
jgi:hypothetical protein